MDNASQEKRRWHAFLLIISLSLPSASTLEEDRPAIFLQPRNFNPHPHVARFDTEDRIDDNRGPVVFPPSPPDEENAVNRNVLTVDRERNLNHPIDNHPYAKVARKHKHKLPSRFNGEDNRINPRVYEALSNHAAKVLSEPASQLGKDYTLSSLSDQPKNYAFSYKVVDHLTGDDFSHTQSQNSRATNGEYRVKLPDGRVQIVSYTADKNGYKADVKYTENEPSSPNIQIQDIADQGRGQIRPLPILKTNSYDYQYDDISGSHLQTQYDGEAALYAPLPTEPSKVPLDYGAFITATPSPVLYRKSGLHFATESPQPKVEIYTNNNALNRFDPYVGSTAAPYLYENYESPSSYQGVASTVAPNVEDYSDVYASTPKFGLLQRHYSK